MIDPPDAALLKDFVRRRDETAFQTLAKRHFGLIFHTAWRRTGNRVLAEDISQEVLCLLARKAAHLAVHPERLPSWLHRTTLYECSAAMRKESSQEKRRQQFAEAGESAAPQLPAPEHDSPLWQEALPHLDQALDRIPESDRRVLLLHFFESLPFPRIGALMGKSPAAVQKQSVRALEKLSRLLRPGKTALPLGLLASGLAAESAKAAPFGLIPAFTAHAISTTTTASGLSVMLATHQKVLIPCALLVLIVPLGLQQAAIAGTGREIARLQASLSTSIGKPSSLGPRTRAISSSWDLQQLAQEALLAGQSPPLALALRRKLAGLDANGLAEFMRKARTTPMTGRQREALTDSLAGALCRKDPALTVRTLAEVDRLYSPLIRDAYGLWLRSDLNSARDWLFDQQRLPANAATSPRQSFGGMAQSPEMKMIFSRRGSGEIQPIRITTGVNLQQLAFLQGCLFRELLASDEAAAKDFMKSVPQAASQLEIILSAFFQPGQALTDSSATTLLDFLHGLTTEQNRSAYLAYVATSVLWQQSNSLSNVDPLLRAGSLSEPEKLAIAQTAVKQYLLPRGYPRDPALEVDAQAWLQTTFPGTGDEVWKFTMDAINTQQEAEAEAALERLGRFKETDDGIVFRLQSIALRTESQIGRAKELAAKVQDPAKRESLLKYLNELPK